MTVRTTGLSPVAWARAHIRLPVLAWSSLLVTLTAMLTGAGILLLPLGLEVPPQLRWASRVVLLVGFLVGVIGQVTGTSVVQMAHFARTRLERAAPAHQVIVTAVSLSLVLGPVLSTVVYLASRPSQDRTAVEGLWPRGSRDLALPEGSTPWLVARGRPRGVWVADFSRPAVAYVEYGRPAREYTLPEVTSSPDAPSMISASVVGLASDSAGNAWVLSTQPRTLLTGVDAEGRVIAQLAAPSGSSGLVIDRRDVAWLVDSTDSGPGVKVLRLDLRTRRLDEGQAFSGVDVPTGDALLALDPSGTPWLLARDTQQTPHLPRVGRDLQTAERPVSWPKDTVWPADGDPLFQVTDSGSVWIAVLGALDEVAPDGQVTRHPLYRNSVVQSMTTLPDGRVAFSWLLGVTTWFSDLTAPQNQGYYSVFDPKSASVFPTINRSDAPQARLATARPGLLIRTGMTVVHVTDLSASPAWTGQDAVRDDLRREIATYHASETALDAALSQSALEHDLDAIESLHATTAAELTRIIDASPVTVPAAVSTAVHDLVDKENRDRAAFAELRKVADPTATPGYFIKLRLLQDQFRAGVNSLYLQVSDEALSPQGTSGWRTGP